MSPADSSAPTSAPTYEVGTLIADKYRLTERIGEGAMGSIWAARNEVLDSNVAIKLIRPDTEHAAAGDRLLKEARAASKLGHPAIVRIFDFGHTIFYDPYLVMERLEGESLGVHLERRLRLDAIRAVQTVLPIIGALVAAHEQGIVHRDVKPENIFLAQVDGRRVQPKLLDFGVAKLAGPGAKGAETLEGTLVGSAPYMSPEQARGLPNIDQRADIWAISVVLYELVTGQRPFSGPNYNAVMMAIVSEDPAPVTSRAAGDAELWGLLGKGLEKDPADRWQSARDLGAALARWALDRGCADDLSGASLQAAWFDQPISSAPPPSSEARTSVPSFDAKPDRLAETVAGSRRSEDVESAMRPIKQRWSPALFIGAGIVLALIGGAAALVFGTGTDEAPSSPPGSSGEEGVAPIGAAAATAPDEQQPSTPGASEASATATSITEPSPSAAGAVSASLPAGSSAKGVAEAAPKPPAPVVRQPARSRSSPVPRKRPSPAPRPRSAPATGLKDPY